MIKLRRRPEGDAGAVSLPDVCAGSGEWFRQRERKLRRGGRREISSRRCECEQYQAGFALLGRYLAAALNGGAGAGDRPIDMAPTRRRQLRRVYEVAAPALLSESEGNQA